MTWHYELATQDNPNPSAFTVIQGMHNLSDARFESLPGDSPDNNNDEVLAIRLQVPQGTTVTRIIVNAQWNRPINHGGADQAISVFHDSVALIVGQSLSSTGSGSESVDTNTLQYPLVIDDGEIEISGWLDGTGGSVWLHYTSVVIVGEGINPFDPNHNGHADCPICYNSSDGSETGEPISMWGGEKRETITDLSVNTPAGALAFTRSYRQSKNDYSFDPDTETPEEGFATPLGAGWTHNHDIRIFTHTNYPNKLLVKMPSGGIAHFGNPVSGVYTGDPGSNSKIDANGGTNDKYTLTASDESVWVFDDQGRIRSRTWANGEVWTYSYYSSSLLQEVFDGYGRKLQFTYIDNAPGGIPAFNHEQLEYVGDHTVADITNPVEGKERFVKFSYTENKKEQSGAIVAGGQALLVAVTDLHNQIWTYMYEAEDIHSLNWISQEKSPSVNVDGDVDTMGEDILDGEIILKQLVYYPFEDLAVNGDMEDTTGWNDVGSPITGQSTTQVYEGTNSWKVEADVDEGLEGNEWDLEAGRTYTLRARVYVVSGSVEMRVTGLSASFPVASVPTPSAWQELVLVLKPEFASTGHKLQFLATANGSEFYVDAVTIEVAQQITQERGKHVNDADFLATTDFTFQPSGDNITIEKTAGRETTHYFNGSLYSGTENPAGEGGVAIQDASFRPASQQDANGNATQLDWSSDGKKLNSVKDAENHKTFFKYDDEDRLYISTDAETRFTIYSYNGSERQPNLIRVVDGRTLIANGDMEELAGWTGVGTPTTNAQNDVEVFTGVYSRHVVADDTEGISSVDLHLKAGETYRLVALVRPVSGQVKMQLSTVSVLSATSTDEWEELNLTYTPSSDETANLQFIANSGAATFYVDTVGRLVRRQEFVYDAKGRTLEDKLIDTSNEVGVLQKMARQYYAYDALGTDPWEIGDAAAKGDGLLYRLTQLEIDDSMNPGSAVEYHTFYEYDDAGRVIKVEKQSFFGTCEFSYTAYDHAGNVRATACGFGDVDPYGITVPMGDTWVEAWIDTVEGLYNPSNPTQFTVTKHKYDEMGRRVLTTTNVGAANERATRTIYDALSRVVRTIGNYVEQLDLSSEVVPPGGWVWKNNQWEYSDTDSTPVSHGTNNDENIISDTDYNERGLVYRRRDVLGRVTLSGYDLADRLVKTVQNASQPDYDASYATGDPQLRRYRADSSIVDGDVISEQFYDAAGNLVKSIDARGSVSYTVYDALNRPTRTVQNAKADATIDLNVGDTGYSATNDPRSAGYVPSSAPDEDLISETVYDAMGRVLTSQRLLENRGASAVWDTTYFVYDELGRQKRVIQHYVAQGTSDPADWVYESGVWKQAPSGTAISHGNNDQNIITETVYDVSGRVKETLDVNRRVTRFVYDGLNRQVMIIANYVAQATEPEAWAWSSTNEQWEYSTNNAVSHGANNDENIISHTEYDGDGRVLETRNVEGLVQRNAYDTAGRSYLTVANYVDNSYQSPSLWAWDAGQTQWEDGNNVAIDRGTGVVQNLISQPEYDSENRVFQTRDSRGNLTRQVYDEAGRRVMTISNYVAQATEPEEWVWRAVMGVYGWRLSATNDALVSFGTNNDQNRISYTTYDILGRVVTTRDAVGRVSRTIYDALGRRNLVLQNEVAQANPLEEWEWDAVDKRWEDGSGTAIQHGTDFDQNIIAQTIYNRAGQVVSTRDARGTETAFEYDGAGRRVMVTAAANTGQRARTYTCYDKAGRVLRTIQGYEPTGVDPDAWDAGTWVFAPTTNGYHHDENRITEHEYDAASRRVKTINPEGDEVETAYFLDGQVDSMTDPMDVVTVYRYDHLNRRKLVVQNYVSNAEDPALWVWDTNQYEESDGTPIAHGTDNDENIIVQVEYDIAGRMTQMRDPRGNVTSYEYDVLGRRTKLTNPLSNEWVTAYTEVSQAQRTTMTYPGLSTGGTYNVVRDFDRMGRLLQMDYNAATTTPKVNFTYDILGNRQTMVENNGTSDIRKTGYFYDDANRLTSVEFDNDADNTPEDTVEYEYDLGGRRTKLTMPGSMEISYAYDQKGRLIALTDWDGQTTSFAYDKADRHVRTRRSNGLDSLYQHDAAGRLRTLHHLKGGAELRQSFAYAVNALGNRTQAQEITPRTSGATAADMEHDYPAIVYRGDWRDVGLYHEATVHDASLSILFYGETATLKMGVGSDYSVFDVYIDGTLWLSFDGYADTEGEMTPSISINVEGAGLHLLEVKNRLEKNVKSSGYKIRFKLLNAQPAFDVTTIVYGYDGLSRLLSANYSVGADYTYGYDVAGNLVNNNGVTRTYNAANQMVDDGTNTLTYDANGNLTNDGVNAYTWDRANRMLTAPGSTSYKYDGLSNRIQQTVSSVVTDYLNDVQPGLVKLLRQDDGSNVDHFVHAVRGIHAVDDGTDWTWYAQDGLGSVRGLVDDAADVVSSQMYDPYGVPDGAYGSGSGYFGFTGEQTDANGQVYLRARYYAPSKSMFTALDPFEGMMQRPMSLNGYSWVESNPVMNTDPSGMLWWGRTGLFPSFELSAPPRQHEITDYVGNVLQFVLAALPGTDRIYHAEYFVDKEHHEDSSGLKLNYSVDLIKVDGNVNRIWEIKPNNEAARGVGRAQARTRLNMVQEAQAEGIARIYSSSGRPHPIIDFEYDWSSHQWQLGENFPPKVFLGRDMTGINNWYAGQLPGSDNHGLIVYWKENNEDEPSAPAFAGDRIREIPDEVSDSNLIDAQSPGNVLYPDFGRGSQQPGREVNQPAAFSPTPGQLVIGGVVIIGTACLATLAFFVIPGPGPDEAAILTGGATILQQVFAK